MRINASTGRAVGQLLTVLVGAGGLTACQLLGPACVRVEPAAVRVTVVDSITGELVEGEGVTVVVADGEYVDTANHFRNGRYAAAYGRGGVYRVEVTAPGYTPWVREGVTVGRDECGIVTTEIEARMVREEAGTARPTPTGTPPPEG